MKRIQRFLAVLLGLTISACALVNTSIPQHGTPLATLLNTDQPLAEDGEPINNDWFLRSKPIFEFDLDKNNIIDRIEAYMHAKDLRVTYLKSPFMIKADKNKNGFVQQDEWIVAIAESRVDGSWLKQWDVNRDGKLSVEEELLGVNTMKQVEAHYNQTCQTTALSFQNSIDTDKLITYDKDKDYKITSEEFNDYINTEFFVEYYFFFDWDGNGLVEGVEKSTSNQALLALISQINDYLQSEMLRKII